MSAYELSILMQHLGQAIEKLNSQDFQLLLANKATVNIVVTPSTEKMCHAIPKSEVIGQSELTTLIQQLDDSSSRDQGALLLKSLTKAQLQSLAKYISVSVDSGASKDRIVEKIVERRVGLRLRQDAFAQVMNVN